jgi:hypothetical protein
LTRLRNALSFIKDLADFINSNKSDADNINKILVIQEGLLNTPEEFALVIPRRKYVDEGVSDLFLLTLPPFP